MQYLYDFQSSVTIIMKSRKRRILHHGKAVADRLFSPRPWIGNAGKNAYDYP